MVFASMAFLWVFFPITLCLYYLLGISRKQDVQNLLLLIMSLIFYFFGEPKYILLLLACVAVNYAGGLMIERQDGRKKKTALAITLILSLSMLLYFKYAEFIAENISGAYAAVTGADGFSVKKIALPIGISFYTFQAVSYTIDLYRGKCGVQRSFWKLLLYISFFPQLIAGPIVRYRDIENQIEYRTVTIEKFAYGCRRFIIGLAKKVLLANMFAAKADLIFGMPADERSAAAAWMGILLYTLQIYYDFSGYSDMAIGMGKMFGFDFLENFRLPYLADSITDFWRRWHISLSTWFKEYLYIPLGGNRKGKKRTYINLLVVFLITGIWHGAGWTFLFWGLFHGLFRLLEKAGLGEVLDKCRFRLIPRLYTIAVVMTAWIFFRADTLKDAFSYIGSLFRLNVISPYGWNEMFGTKCTVLCFIGILLGAVIPEKIQEKLADSPAFGCICLPAFLFLSICTLASDSYNPFIYFRF